MARMTQKLLDKIWKSTEDCWHKAVDDFYITHPNEPRLEVGGYRHIYSQHKEAIDQAYRFHLSKLTTQEIELVIEAYKKKKQRRSQVTMDYLTGVLLERCMDTIKK
jgi:hypothetical protein